MEKSPSPAENCQLPLPFSAVQSCNSARAKMSRSPLLPKQLQSSPSTHRRIIYSSGTIFLVFFYTGTILPSALTVAPLLTWEICPKAVTNKLLRAREWLLWKLQVSQFMLILNSKAKKIKKAPQNLVQPEWPLLEASQFWDRKKGHHNWASGPLPCGHFEQSGAVWAPQLTFKATWGPNFSPSNGPSNGLVMTTPVYILYNIYIYNIIYIYIYTIIYKIL